MSEEYDTTAVDNNAVYHSAFWPLVIVLAGFIISLGYQVYELNAQRSGLTQLFESATPTLIKAKGAQDRLIALMKDLVTTSDKDPYAKQVLKEAIDAGMIQVNQNQTNAAPAAPASGEATK